MFLFNLIRQTLMFDESNRRILCMDALTWWKIEQILDFEIQEHLVKYRSFIEVGSQQKNYGYMEMDKIIGEWWPSLKGAYKPPAFFDYRGSKRQMHYEYAHRYSTAYKRAGGQPAFSRGAEMW